MIPVIASAKALPFSDGSFDVVVASDVLEHVPTPVREIVIREALRVARNLAIFAFPCGKTAHCADRALLETYAHKNLEIPIWLKEHMLEDFPEHNLFAGIENCEVRDFGNESIRFHSWIMRMEMYYMFNYATQASIRIAPRFIESLLRLLDRAPYYRRIFVLRKTQSQGSGRETDNQA